MAEYADEHERTMAFAEIALGQIKALRQAATPRNYEIWYAYATGYHPSLNQKINETLKSSGVLAEHNLENIYATYLSPTRLTERIDEVGSQVKGEIEQVMSMIDTAAGSASSYTESLVDMSAQDRPVEGPRGPAHDRRKPGANRQGDGSLQPSSWKSGSTPPSAKSSTCTPISRRCAAKA